MLALGIPDEIVKSTDPEYCLEYLLGLETLWSRVLAQDFPRSSERSALILLYEDLREKTPAFLLRKVKT